MTPTDVERSRTPAQSREQLTRARQRRQTYTFISVLTTMLVVGLVAWGNWQSWWTIGGTAQATTVMCPTQTVVDPELTDVTVINGTERNGLAAAVAKELQKRRFRVMSIETEALPKPLKSVVMVRYGAAGKLAAHTVALQFPAKTIMIQDKRDGAAIDVVIGEKYRSMVSAKKATAAMQQKAGSKDCRTSTSAVGLAP
jgi:LytR cell envelope-related transcriptional attenuator